MLPLVTRITRFTKQKDKPITEEKSVN
jgi:hypothetical protein